MAAAALVAALALAPRAAAMPSETADRSWGVDGRVSAIVQVGGVVIVGGAFSQALEDGGAGTATLPRANLAAFDATTGAPLPGWDPLLNGAVYALALAPDGGRLYVGGAFTTVDGVSRTRLAAIDVATGSLIKTFKPPFTVASVRALAVSGTRVYAGGLFRTMAGQIRERLAAVDAGTGALDPVWAPAADAGVRTLAASPDGSRIYAGGDFTTISGQPRRQAAALGAADGGVIGDWHPDPGYPVLGLAVTGSGVYAAGGGAANQLAAWDATTGAVLWMRHSDGDFQAIAASGSLIYAGGHFNYYEGELRRKLVAVDSATGELRRGWRPVLPHTDLTWEGVWALSTAGGTRLAVGGDFDSVTGVTQRHYAQFTGTIDGAVGDSEPPTRPAGLVATPRGSSRVELAWSASSDDDGVAKYEVWRDGLLVGTASSAGFADLDVAPDTTYAYAVQPVDFAGNRGEISETATATTPVSDEIRTFTAVEDADIDATQPTKVAGANTTVKADSSPDKDFLMKFDLAGLAGRQIIRARLRLYCSDASNNGGDFSLVRDNSWTEKTVSWSTAPPGDSVVTDTLNDVLVNTFYNLDVTPLVTGDGTLSLRTSTPSSNSSGFHSSEGANPPQLVVTLADPGTTVPREPLFSDGFETGDLTRWSSVAGLTVNQDAPFSGRWAAHAHAVGQGASVYKQLRRAEPELFTKLRFKLHSTSSGSVALLRYRTGTAGALVRLFVAQNGMLGIRNDVTGTSVTSATGVSVDRWHTIQLHARAGGASGQVDVALDGARVADLTSTATLGDAPIGRVQLGDDSLGKTYDFGFDDVTVDTQEVPDATGPTRPAGLRVTDLTSESAAIAWDPSADDYAVTGYRIYRDGDLLATVGPGNAHTDSTVAPASSYSYEVQAVDAAGNLSPRSEPLVVTTPELDTTAPSTPVVAATAVSFDRVDLSWAPSTDDVETTGYAIYRDGTLLGTVDGQTTSYRDRTVAPATIYSYAVEAFDRAGNRSPRSDAASATTYPATLFRDGFESGDLSQWTKVSGLAAEAGDSASGAWHARAMSAGQPSYAYRQLTLGVTDLEYAVRFKVARFDPASASLLKLRTGAGTALLRLFVSGAGRLAVRNDTTAVTTTSTTTIAAGRWYEGRVHVTLNGAASAVEVFLDGARVATLSGSQSLGTTPIGRVQLGDDAAGKQYDIVFDDLVLAAAPANSGRPVVTGTPRAGETLTGGPGVWSGTQPLSFAYRWQRCDATGQACADIDGATDGSYALTGDDVGFTVRAVVTATNSDGSGVAASDATTPVEAP
jgi:chitodextrinase